MRQIGTGSDNPDFAMARACGVEDVPVDRAGVWELPGLGPSNAGTGTRDQPA